MALRRLWRVAVMAWVVLAAPALPAAAEQRVALVIGNSAYASIPRLANPARDAALMAAALGDVGFDVVVVRDADRDAMAKAIQEFGRRLRAGGAEAVGLFYFAGHGVQSRGVNYLIPVQAAVANEADLEIEAVSAQWVLSQMAFAGNSLNIVILDACRNNPFEGGFRYVAQGLARMDAPSGALVAYAAAPGQVAADGTGANSPYTAALADTLREPGLRLEDVFKRVRLAVESATGEAQTPWEESSLKGDFYFAGPPAAGGQTAGDLDRTFWTSIEDSTNPASFEAYLKQFPEGVFADLARLRLEELRGAATETEVAAAETRRTDEGADQTDYENLRDAAWGGGLAAVEAFIAGAADIDAPDQDGDTALHLAAVQGHTDVVRALIAAGAAIDARSANGHEPLHYAAEQGNADIVRVLLDAGAAVDAQSDGGHAPLHYAAGADHLAVARMLLAAEADTGLRDEDGDTPLHFAAVSGDGDLAQALLDAGAAVNARSRDGCTPLDYAHEKANGAVVDLLRARGGERGEC